MSDQAGSLQILIDVRSKLDELVRSQEAFRKTREEAQGFGNMLKTGFGIDLARRGLDLLTGSLRAAGLNAFQAAREIQNQSRAVGASIEEYQVLRDLLEENGTEAGVLTQATNAQRQALADARRETSASAQAFRTLGISAGEFERMPLSERLELIGSALERNHDQTAAYDAVSTILGSRTLPALTSSLKVLATDGYAKVAKEAREAGKVADEFSVSRAAEAKKFIEDLQQQAQVAAAESFGFLSLVGKAAATDGSGLGRAAVRSIDRTLGFKPATGEGEGFFDFLANFYTPPSPPPRPPAPVPRAATAEELLRARVDFAGQDYAQITGRAMTTELQKRPELLASLKAQEQLLSDLIALKYSDLDAMVEVDGQRRLAIDVAMQEGKITAEQLQRLQERAAIEARIAEIRSAQRGVAGEGPSAFRYARERFLGIEDATVNRNRLSTGEGVEAGAMNYAASLGSQGEQVATGLQNSIGTTVRGISDVIRGWSVGARDFGDIALQVGDSLFSTLLDTLVQMGAQWLINAALAKGSLISTFLVAVGLRKAETADVIANETAKAPAIQANAAGASISSFGIAAAVGIAALLAAMALFRGFSAGGYTGSGGINEPAGIVHAGEVVWSQADVARSGGVAAVESLRVGGAAVARPINAASLSLPSAVGAAGSAAAKPARLIAIVPDLHSARALQRDPAFENVIVDVMQRRRGDLLG